jgi:hypothetical protein
MSDVHVRPIKDTARLHELTGRAVGGTSKGERIQYGGICRTGRWAKSDPAPPRGARWKQDFGPGQRRDVPDTIPPTL